MNRNEAAGRKTHPRVVWRRDTAKFEIFVDRLYPKFFKTVSNFKKWKLHGMILKK